MMFPEENQAKIRIDELVENEVARKLFRQY